MLRISLVVALLVLSLPLSGCSGLHSSPPSTAVDTPTKSEPPSPTPSPDATRTHGTTYNCSYVLMVEKASEEQVEGAETIVAYENLSDQRRGEFKTAVDDWMDGGSASTNLGDDFPERWSEPPTVTYRADHWATSIATC